MKDTNEVNEIEVGVEAPKTRPPKTEAQLENVKKAEIDQARIDPYDPIGKSLSDRYFYRSPKILESTQ